MPCFSIQARTFGTLLVAVAEMTPKGHEWPIAGQATYSPPGSASEILTTHCPPESPLSATGLARFAEPLQGKVEEGTEVELRWN